ncbi:MAG TPA: hypothetical protein H9738_07790 [Candidatus Blautia pullistercoris]|uniref:Uncharacterized protein n=1 Tax=Candidatus Blautia pullistercoris TaxID=2838499 RepID=A0A9D1VMV3_9FIRM|nr:hypothetical protein [Clostridiales bacterium]HIX37753.1 hypothetical protein [Candidatus Blautia pullistercoris]
MFGELMGEGKTIMGVIEGDAVPKVFIPRIPQKISEAACLFQAARRFFCLL